MKLIAPKRREVHALPVLPLKNSVLFPSMTVPVFVNRSEDSTAVRAAMAADRTLVAVTLKNAESSAKPENLVDTGVIAKIVNMIRLPDGSLRLLIEAVNRVQFEALHHDEYLSAAVKPFPTTQTEAEQIKPYVQAVSRLFEAYQKINPRLPKDLRKKIDTTDTAEAIIDILSGTVLFELEDKLRLLREQNLIQRAELLAELLQSEIELLQLKDDIDRRVQKRMEKHQREYFLQEQIKEINRELGSEDDDLSGVREFEKRLDEKKIPESVRDRIVKEIARLKKLQPMSPEAGIIRTYIDLLTELPWTERSEDRIELAAAREILDRDHYDLEKPKQRVLEYIAVRKLNSNLKGPILCFAGPPGTGKTSLGQSLARALDRRFVRISLGGVRDEAEIRGHRRTYVGALPGKIISAVSRAGTRNPVILLDEIDKIGNDFRGDPASALLEVLDPEQNRQFVDHYLEVSFDLSDVLFVTTANGLHTVPPALQDRMEVIEIPGYSDFDKVHIAERHLIPRQIVANGLETADIRFYRDAILEIIHSYTMESGVRNLEREIASVSRKIALEAVEKHGADITGYVRRVRAATVRRYLGPQKLKETDFSATSVPGFVVGLAWTQNGGTVLPVEAGRFPGTGKLILTGNLGDVMKESAQAALSFIRAQCDRFGLNKTDFSDYDMHVHVPEGAIPKDGPSAGITITAALVSALTGTAVAKNWAMTGEITLSGRILPVGGIKEKVLAAHRRGISQVLLPEDNRVDVDELPREVKTGTQFAFVRMTIDALDLVFPDRKANPAQSGV